MSTHVKVAKDYHEGHMRTLGNLEAMRLRPGMYIGSIGPRGVYKLFIEVFTNAIDEFNSGRVHLIKVFIDTKNSTYTVEDDGVGIPLGKLYDAITDTHSGGKFDGNDGAFDFSAGMNGVGLKANNALGDPFHIDVRRDGKRVQYWFSKGEKTNHKEEPWKGPTGTIVTVKPDIQILQDITIDKRLFLESMNVMVCVNAGIRVEVTIDGKEKHTIVSVNGLLDILQARMKSHHIHPMVTPVVIKSLGGKMEYEAVFTFSQSVSKETMFSYVNGLATAEHGHHVTALRSALTEVFGKYIAKGDYIPKNAKYEVSGDDIRENLVAVVSARLANPLFDGQTKERLNDARIAAFARSIAVETIQKWVDKNDAEADKIAKHVVRLARARAAARDAKNAIIKTGPRSGFMDRVDAKKFKSCRSKDPSKCELFIVEGESAGGTANEGRDTEFQALFYLKGKMQNVIANGNFGPDSEIAMLGDVLGIGFGESYDPDKLRFHKVVIMTDADDDGYHIAALAFAFFFKFCPELIERGHIYVACPPLYYVKGKKNGFYLANVPHYKFALKEIAVKTFDLIGPSGKKASENLFRVYLEKIDGYKSFLDAVSIRISVVPELIELIVRNYDDTKRGRFSVFKEFGYSVSITEKKDDHVLIDFDRGFEHSFVKFDKTFHDTVFVPVMKRLISIRLSNVRLRGIKSGKIYDGTTYDIARIIESVIMGKGVSVKRFKGLGELFGWQLKETALDPATRKITQITMRDRKLASEWMEVLMGKDKDGQKKEMFS